MGDVVAHRLFGKPEVRGDLGVVQALRDALQDVGLSRRELPERVFWSGFASAKEGVQFVGETPESGLRWEQKMVVALESHETGARNERAEKQSLVVRHPQIPPAMDHQRGAAHL